MLNKFVFYFNLKKKFKQNYGNKNCNLTIYNYVFQIPSQAKISNSREKKKEERKGGELKNELVT